MGDIHSKPAIAGNITLTAVLGAASSWELYLVCFLKCIATHVQLESFLGTNMSKAPLQQHILLQKRMTSSTPCAEISSIQLIIS
jgi:hypothetical protein